MECEYCSGDFSSMCGLLRHLSLSHEDKRKREFLVNYLKEKFDSVTITRKEFGHYIECVKEKNRSEN